MPDTQQEAQPLVLACVLTGDDLAARGEAVRPLIASHQKLQELEDGYAFQFPGEPEWIHRVVSFVAEERACCPFFTFELHYEPHLGPIWLRLRGSAEIKALLRDQWLTQLSMSELECEPGHTRQRANCQKRWTGVWSNSTRAQWRSRLDDE